jgi:hypothetical protein
MELFSHLQAQTSLRQEKELPRTNWIGRWVSPWADLNFCGTEKSPATAGSRATISVSSSTKLVTIPTTLSVFQSTISHYNDYASSAIQSKTSHSNDYTVSVIQSRTNHYNDYAFSVFQSTTSHYNGYAFSVI